MVEAKQNLEEKGLNDLLKLYKENKKELKKIQKEIQELKAKLKADPGD